MPSKKIRFSPELYTHPDRTNLMQIVKKCIIDQFTRQWTVIFTLVTGCIQSISPVKVLYNLSSEASSASVIERPRPLSKFLPVQSSTEKKRKLLPTEINAFYTSDETGSVGNKIKIIKIKYVLNFGFVLHLIFLLFHMFAIINHVNGNNYRYLTGNPIVSRLYYVLLSL